MIRSQWGEAALGIAILILVGVFLFGMIDYLCTPTDFVIEQDRTRFLVYRIDSVVGVNKLVLIASFGDKGSAEEFVRIKKLNRKLGGFD